MRIKLWAVAIALVVAGAACGKKDGVKKPGVVPSGPDGWAYYIPADSPLVVANLEPMPESLVNWVADGLAPLAAMGEKAIGDELAESTDETERAVLTELQGKLSRQGLADIGVSLNPRFALYGVGLSLAIRLELADGQRFRGFIERLEKAAGKPMERASLEGVEYLRAGDEEVAVIVALREKDVTLGVMHAKASELVLPVLLGVQRPQVSVGDTGVLPKLAKQYKLMGVSTGYFDSQALAHMLTGRASALSQGTLTASGVDLSEFATPACQKEFDSLAAIAPRVVFDYTAIQPPRLETAGVVELRSDIARDLAGVQTPVHGLGDASRPRLFALGVGLDLEKAIAWLHGKAKGVVAAPYQCPALAGLNEFMGDLDRELEGVQGSMPPFLAGFRGVSMVIEDLQMGGFIPSGAGYVVLGVAQPMAVIEMVGAFLPQLAQVKVKDGGAPTAVTTGVPGLDPVHVTVQGSWLGAAVGKGMSEQMVAALRATPSGEGPFMVMAYDYARFVEVIQAAGGSEMDPTEKLLMDAMGKLLGFTTASMRFEPQGLVIHQTIQGR
jgi:hypothetical protein